MMNQIYLSGLEYKELLERMQCPQKLIEVV
jgi:hypothetical protein